MNKTLQEPPAHLKGLKTRLTGDILYAALTTSEVFFLCIKFPKKKLIGNNTYRLADKLNKIWWHPN